jgi:hypothetical protein
MRTVQPDYQKKRKQRTDIIDLDDTSDDEVLAFCHLLLSAEPDIVSPGICRAPAAAEEVVGVCAASEEPQHSGLRPSEEVAVSETHAAPPEDHALHAGFASPVLHENQ